MKYFCLWEWPQKGDHITSIKVQTLFSITLKTLWPKWQSEDMQTQKFQLTGQPLLVR